MGYLRKAAKEHDVTALVSLHQVNIAAHFGDRFIGLRDGRKLFDIGREELSPELIDDLYGNVETVGLAEQEKTIEGVIAESDGNDNVEREIKI
jgi:phosphonate transport system ATP-binding protein